MSDIIPEIEKFIAELIADAEKDADKLIDKVEERLRQILHEWEYDKHECDLIIKGMRLAKKYPIFLNLVSCN